MFDDILIIYNQRITNIEQTLNEFIKLQNTINFAIEKAKQKSINFLDLRIQQNNKNLQLLIYRKSTQTNIIIPNSSCHPHKHKLPSINYLLR
jgi:hypothetical protein